jgi:hypothetical protein
VKRAVLIGAVVLGLLGASGAEARTTIIEPPGSHGTYQRWVDGALVDTYGGTVELSADLSVCENELLDGCAFRSGAHIVVGPSHPRFVFFHELGHVYDFTVLTPQGRDEFRRINGLTTSWEESPDPPTVEGFGRQPPSEMFADAYAVCASVRRPWFAYFGNEGHTRFAGLEGFGLEWEPRHWQFVKTCELVGRRVVRPMKIP